MKYSFCGGKSFVLTVNGVQYAQTGAADKGAAPVCNSIFNVIYLFFGRQHCISSSPRPSANR